MSWFDDLKAALPKYYDSAHPANVVGYLRGSAEPSDWRRMDQTGSGQMIILGNVPPTQKEWDAAGVGQRGQTQTITFMKLAGFIVIYGGFIYRPWGHIVVSTGDLVKRFSGQITNWKNNAPR
jgi:hypothetical protein